MGTLDTSSKQESDAEESDNTLFPNANDFSLIGKITTPKFKKKKKKKKERTKRAQSAISHKELDYDELFGMGMGMGMNANEIMFGKVTTPKYIRKHNTEKKEEKVKKPKIEDNKSKEEKEIDALFDMSDLFGDMDADMAM